MTVSADPPLYLRPNALVEPCVASWYAYPHLISPATAAMNFKNRLIPILQDYIRHPEAHANACRDPYLRGGPYVDLHGGKVGEIKQLLAATLRSCAPLLSLATAFEELYRLLQQEAHGFSMDALYARVPAALRGYVELVYDLAGRPDYRIKESLLYHSRYYPQQLQSLLAYTVADDSRPFVLSTPRLDRDDSVRLTIPFRHESLDALFAMTRVPQSCSQICATLGVVAAERAAFEKLLTPVPPAAAGRYTGSAPRIRYFGHACVLFETSEVSILTDPVISYGYDSKPHRRTYADLPERIDYVLITHNHQDHVLLETMLHLRHKVGCWVVPARGASTLVDPGLRLMLTELGFRNVIELGELQKLTFPEGDITGLPFLGEHGDLDIASKLAYLIRFRRFQVMCLADSQNVEPKIYEHLHALVGDVDILFIGMECNGAPVSWMYGPYFPQRLSHERDVTRRIASSRCDAALDIVKRFNVKQAYVYAMGMEPWVRFLSANVDAPDCEAITQSDGLVNECTARGIVAERLYAEKQIFCPA